MSTTLAGHHCQYREDDNGRWRSVTKWWLLPTHITLAAALAFTLLQFVSPILSGAVNWIPAVELVPAQSPAQITTAGQCSQWGSFNFWPNNRFYEVLMGAGLASIASPVNFKSSDGQVYRRKIPSLLGT